MCSFYITIEAFLVLFPGQGHSIVTYSSYYIIRNNTIMSLCLIDCFIYEEIKIFSINYFVHHKYDRKGNLNKYLSNIQFVVISRVFILYIHYLNLSKSFLSFPFLYIIPFPFVLLVFVVVVPKIFEHIFNGKENLFVINLK